VPNQRKKKDLNAYHMENMKTILFALGLIALLSLNGLSDDVSIEWSYDNDEYWKSDTSNLFGANSSLTTGIVEFPTHRIMAGKIPNDGNIFFAWEKNYVNDIDAPSIDYINLSFYKNNLCKKSCKSREWSDLTHIKVLKGDNIKFELFNECPPCSDVRGWLYFQYIPVSDPDPKNKEEKCFIPAEANLSYIEELLQKPSDTFEVGNGANLQDINDALEVLQKKGMNQHKVFYLQNGEYNGSIVISAKNFSIKAENGNAKIISDNLNDFNILMNDASDVLIEGLTIENSQYGIYLSNCFNCKVKSNYIRSFGKTGLLVVTSNGISAIDNSISTSGSMSYGIHIDSSECLTLIENEINVQDYEYYFINQTNSLTDSKNKINIKYANQRTGIYDNGDEYYATNSFIYRDNESFIGSKLETKYNIWEARS
jgi:parallel beta-helix repeat protein